MNYIEYIANKSRKASLHRRWQRLIPLVRRHHLVPLMNIIIAGITDETNYYDDPEIFFVADKLPNEEKLQMVEMLEEGFLHGTTDEHLRFERHEIISTQHH